MFNSIGWPEILLLMVVAEPVGHRAADRGRGVLDDMVLRRFVGGQLDRDVRLAVLPSLWR